MKSIKSIAICVFLLLGLITHGQLSPGDLSEAHAHLEGMSNCTKCHTLGDKVSNQKCLDCHQFLAERIKYNKGYHSSVDVRGKDCFSCHSEHHGRKFEMIRFDQDKFNHDLTGYRLEGQHKQIDCRACHTDDNIIDYEIKELKNTYLGLTTECLSCHDDYHQNTLSAKCQDCHTFDSFEEAENFDHSQDTKFALRGEHVSVDCRSCHTNEEEWSFEVPFYQKCVDCHEDPHQSRLGSQCTDCHSESGFKPMLSASRFNHQSTGYPLQGAHARVSCFDCHEVGIASTVFSDFRSKEPEDCRLCHQDVHEGRFGTNCLECHNYDSFLGDLQLDGFNHGLTDFPLQGKHAQVDCRECHQDDLTASMEHDRCLSCHDDHHQGQIVDANDQPRDCSGCHNEIGFEWPDYDWEDHNESSFPLEGGHLATPCFACHLQEDQWVYKDLDRTCFGCHENIHGDRIGEEFMGDNECSRCHVPDTWSAVSFDHNRTNYPLEGAHVNVACRSCHFENTIEVENEQTFSGLSHHCYDCHWDQHRGQFVEEDVTDCASCHEEEAWVPSLFDHDDTDFPLDGAHANLDCVKCHNEQSDAQGIFVSYYVEKFECQDCHGQ